MTARINQLRTATAARISQLILPQTVQIISRPKPLITVDLCRDVAIVTTNGAAQQFTRDSRGSARHQPIVVVAVHRTIPANADGELDDVFLDLAIDLTEAIAEQLMGRFPDLAWARPNTVEIPRLFDQQRIETDGLYQSGILITFETEFEVNE